MPHPRVLYLTLHNTYTRTRHIICAGVLNPFNFIGAASRFSAAPTPFFLRSVSTAGWTPRVFLSKASWARTQVVRYFSVASKFPALSPLRIPSASSLTPFPVIHCLQHISRESLISEYGAQRLSGTLPLERADFEVLGGIPV